MTYHRVSDESLKRFSELAETEYRLHAYMRYTLLGVSR